MLVFFRFSFFRFCVSRYRRTAQSLLPFALMVSLPLLSWSCSAERDGLPLALASSLSPVAEQLGRMDIRAEPSLASSGVLSAQIARGAPYAVAVLADDALSTELAAQKPWRRYRCLAEAALGLWLTAPDATELEQLLQRPQLRILIADPATAPAGVAALQLLRRLELTDRDIVRVGSAVHAVRLGLRGAGDLVVAPVPLLRALQRQNAMSGHWIEVGVDCCRVSYQAVLLQDSEEARQLFELLFSEPVAELLREAGFDEPQSTTFCAPDDAADFRVL